METRWPIGDRPGWGGDDIDSNRRRFGRLRPVPPRWRLRQDGRERGYEFDCRDPGRRADTDRQRSCPQRRLGRTDQGRQGFQPALGKSRDRRAGFGDAAGPGLFVGWTNLPGFSGELRQRPVGTLAAGRRLPDRPWKVGNSYVEAVEAGLRARHPVAKMPRRPQIKANWASSPEFNIRFPI